MNEAYIIPDYYIQILIWVLIAEVVLIVILLFAIVFVKFWNSFQKRKEDFARRRIAQKIMEYMKMRGPLGNLLTWLGEPTKRLLLQELETFNLRFSGEDWENVKEEIAKKYLMELGRKRVGSRNWLKRAFAARCFALCPLIEDKDYILKLFGDSYFQVKGLVTPAIVHLKMKEGVIKMLETMGRSFGYARFFYLDTLVSSKDPEIFHWIAEVAETNPDRDLHLVCLEVLSGKMQAIPESFLVQDVHSQDDELRLAALKVFARNPQKNSLEVLLQYADDPMAEIRKESYKGLMHFRSPRTIHVLEKGLSDNNWNVRVQAAVSLKNMGRPGLDILNKQKADLEPNAYEAAHFILQLDW